MGIFKRFLILASLLGFCSCAFWGCAESTDSKPTSKIKNQSEIEQNLAAAYNLEFAGRQEAFVAQTFWTNRTQAHLKAAQVLIEKAKNTLSESLKSYLLTESLAHQSDVEIRWDERSLSERIAGVRERLNLLENQLLLVQLERSQIIPDHKKGAFFEN